jgi:hypothetical protein
VTCVVPPFYTTFSRDAGIGTEAATNREPTYFHNEATKVDSNPLVNVYDLDVETIYLATSNQCYIGIDAGDGFTFDLDYVSFVPYVENYNDAL